MNQDLDDWMANVIAANVRNAMERFHASGEEDKIAGLDDAAMAKVNPVIRRAIWEVLHDLTLGSAGDEDADERIAFLTLTVPDVWEPGSELPPTT